jgi:dolichol-phosphate mannosyltransferase
VTNATDRPRKRLLVVLPTYNERENLPVLVEQLLAHDGCRVLVVDDQSPDGTGEIADTLARQSNGRVSVLHRTGKRGLGRSYVEALQHAIHEDVDFVCQMDADLSHDPRYLPEMIEALERGRDLVIGSRYLHGVSVVNWPLRRLMLSTGANWYIRTVTGLPLRDCTSGYRCWRRDALARVPWDRIVSEGYAFIVETLYEATRQGCRVGEVPIIFIERREGQSKLSSAVLAESLITPWRVVLRSGRARPDRTG